MKEYIDKVFYKSSEKMSELPDNSVQVIVTSPPYFNIKDYSKDWEKVTDMFYFQVKYCLLNLQNHFFVQ